MKSFDFRSKEGQFADVTCLHRISGERNQPFLFPFNYDSIPRRLTKGEDSTPIDSESRTGLSSHAVLFCRAISLAGSAFVKSKAERLVAGLMEASWRPPEPASETAGRGETLNNISPLQTSRRISAGLAGRKQFHIATSLLIITIMLTTGCLAATEELVNSEPWDSGYSLIDQTPHDDERPFDVADPSDANTTLGNATWAVFDAENGGNCCEHYLAATKDGWILNFGGEYPTWSEDRGHTWQEWRPTILTQFGCRTPKYTVPGQEGLGEGSIVQATNGDIISMGWFPYPSSSGGDQFYAFFYDAAEEEWSWCYNRTPEPFYDRSWQVEVVGPIDSLYGSGPWASLVISNFWHQVGNLGGQISVDGLNYEYLNFPDRDANLEVIEVDLTNSDLGIEWDFTKPHKEMRSFPVPSGGLYFPDYFLDGTDAFLDTSLEWNAATTLGGASLPSEYCSFDSSGALHCVTATGTNILHQLSWDGGESWGNQSYNLSDVATSLEEWEFHANGDNDLFVLNVRYQAIENETGDTPDIDVAWHVRGYSESMEPDLLTYIGQGDLDSTSGAGADIRFDFASMGILPDGGAFIAYHDSTDPDPLFGVELYLPNSNSQ